jgi:hypothetical protein
VLLGQTRKFGSDFEVRPLQGIGGVLALSGLGYNQTTEAELEIERFIDIFLLLEQDIFPNDPHIGAKIGTWLSENALAKTA